MIKKIMLLLISIVILSSCLSDKESWQLDRTISLGELPENVIRVNFYNDKFGVSIDEYNSFYTTDGGKSWFKEESFNSVCLEVIEIFDENDYAIGSCCFNTFATAGNNSGFIEITDTAITAISKSEMGFGFVAGASGRKIFNIENGIVDESNGIKISGAGELISVYRHSESVGFAVDTAYRFFKTEDAGKTWKTVGFDIKGIEKPLGSPMLTKIKFLSDKEIRIITYRKSFTKDGFSWHYVTTLDGGNNWEVEELLIEGLPNGRPEFSKDGNILTITSTRRKKDPLEPTTFVLNHKDLI